MDLSWSLGLIVYHIYVRSFQDSNGDGIGDIEGLLQRLDHVTSLGANAIWLSPIYPSPQADFGYDVSNYINIDPIYGSLTKFDELIKKAHARGIRVMMDYVPNHTSTEHSWFKESRSSKHNSKRDWYIWRTKKSDGSLPNNWISEFGGPAWELDKKTNEYYLHTFDKGQPDLNWRNPEVVEAMLSVLRFWMDRGVNGFRIDVPFHMFKTIDLPDEPPNTNYVPGKHSESESLSHIHSSWLPESFAMMKTFASVLKEYKHKLMISEAWGTPEDLVKLYKTVDWKYYAPFNFSLITLPWNAEIHKQYIDSYDATLGENYIPCYVLGSHDRSRVASRVGEAQARIAAITELTLRGLPFIYNGEEIGMTNTVIPKEEIKDTYELHSPGLKLGRDPQRTPMQWNNTKNAGFSTGKPWLPVNESYKIINVETQEKDLQGMLALYKLLIKLRKHHPSLHDGNYIPADSPAENVLVYLRQKKNEQIIVILNFDEKDKTISLPYSVGTVLCSASMSEPIDKILNFKSLLLKGNEGYVCLLE